MIVFGSQLPYLVSSKVIIVKEIIRRGLVLLLVCIEGLVLMILLKADIKYVLSRK